MEPVNPVLVGEGGFVDADEIGGQDLLQVPKPVLDTVLGAGSVDGDDFSVQNGDALDFGKGKPAQFFITVSCNGICSGKTTDQIFNLLGQGRGGMGDYGDFFVCVFVDNEFVFQGLTSLLSFHLS